MTENELRALLLARSPRPPLAPETPWRNDLTAAIEELATEPLVRAGLHLLNDDLDRCHAIVQEIETPDGNYWHAILHRRGGDLDNARYWYARLGPHPVLAAMRQRYAGWDAASFLRGGETGERDVPLLEEMQAAEMAALLDSLSPR